LIALAPLTIGTKQNHHGAFATMVNFRRNRGESAPKSRFPIMADMHIFHENGACWRSRAWA
jgi:hypothetical protein